MIVKINGRECIRDRPKVGLALSGGGIRGVTHIGILKALDEQHIPVDIIAGTSAGSIIAALYSSGYTTQQMKTLAETIKFNELIDLKISAHCKMKLS